MSPFQVRNVGLSPALSGLVDKGIEMVFEKALDGIIDEVHKTTKHPVGIKILASKPHHAYQERREEIKEITALFHRLKSQNGAEGVVGVYIHGGPAIGKTQLAREFGAQYYEQLKNSRKVGGTAGKIGVVAMLDARTPSSFLRSYLRLAEDLGFPVSRYSGVSNKIQDRVAIISSDVQKKLAEVAPDWLFIVDGIDPQCKLL